MNIILKGVDLPEGTDGLSITFHSQDGVMETHILDMAQAIQIPKGVRLIDANKLWEDMFEGMDFAGYQSWVMDVITIAPPIFESEEE